MPSNFVPFHCVSFLNLKKWNILKVELLLSVMLLLFIHCVVCQQDRITEWCELSWWHDYKKYHQSQYHGVFMIPDHRDPLEMVTQFVIQSVIELIYLLYVVHI